MNDEDEAKFPQNSKSRFVNLLQIFILWSVKVLAALMTLVILWSVINVAIIMVLKAADPTHLINNLDEVLTIFGAFLAALIAIEIFLNIILYLRKDMVHLRLVIATALMAIARKVIILDYEKVGGLHLIGMAAVILALGIAYMLIHRFETNGAEVSHGNK